MKKIINFIWQKKYYFLAVVIAAILIGSRLIKEPTPTLLSQQASFKDLKPGISTEDDLKNTLGDPFRTLTENEQSVFEYQVENSVRYQDIVIKDGKIIFIKEIITREKNIQSQNLIDQYGVPAYKLYDQNSPNSGFNLYVYPDKGIAYIGHPKGILLEIWYFIPMPIKDFMDTWATNYSFSKSSEQVQ